MLHRLESGKYTEVLRASYHISKLVDFLSFSEIDIYMSIIIHIYEHEELSLKYACM